MRKSLYLLGIAVLLSPTNAQVQTVGVTTGLSVGGPYLVSQLPTPPLCPHLTCKTGLPAAPVVFPPPGGTAYDSRQGVVWSTTGTALEAELDPTKFPGCNIVCQQTTAPLCPQADYVTGMAFMDSGTVTGPPPGVPGPRGRLYYLYNNNTLGWEDTSGCVRGNFQCCDLSPSLPPGTTVSGLATDDLRRLIFVGANPNPGLGLPATVYIFDEFCVPLCSVPLLPDPNVCPVGPLQVITGLAYDACKEQLYVTDGVVTLYGTLGIVFPPIAEGLRQTTAPAHPRAKTLAVPVRE